MEAEKERRNYSDENVAEIVSSFEGIRSRFIDLPARVVSFGEKLEHPRAREYFVNGVARRFSVVYRCIANVFRIFPPDRIEKLRHDETLDVDINLHAFLINIYGIIENLGLGVAFEYRLIDENRLEREQSFELGLFNKKFIKKVGGKIEAYFTSAAIIDWYRQYSTDYRDSLAHRIPAYVPPAGLADEEVEKYNEIVKRIYGILSTGWTPEVSQLLDDLDNLGLADPTFVHSRSERARRMILHPQMLCDFRTVEAMTDEVIANFRPPR